MGFALRLALIAFAMTSGCLGSSAAWAGTTVKRLCGKELGRFLVGVAGFWAVAETKKDPIDYREHGKIVVPPKMDLPPPGSSPSADAAWPVNQEAQRKKAQKEAKRPIAGVGDARLRYTHPFDPNTPVTVRAVDPQGNEVKCDNCGSSTLGNLNLNPLNWVGMGKSVPLGPEPDREWLTDPPKGFRAPVEPITGVGGQLRPGCGQRRSRTELGPQNSLAG